MPAGARPSDPLAAGKIKRGDAALALVRAIESTGASDIIVAATYVLLGERTIAAHAADLDRIVRAGGRALTALLIERRGNDVAMVCTLVEMPPAETVQKRFGRTADTPRISQQFRAFS